jgi:hypothetical protein
MLPLGFLERYPALQASATASSPVVVLLLDLAVSHVGGAQTHPLCAVNKGGGGGCGVEWERGDYGSREQEGTMTASHTRKNSYSTSRHVPCIWVAQWSSKRGTNRSQNMAWQSNKTSPVAQGVSNSRFFLKKIIVSHNKIWKRCPIFKNSKIAPCPPLVGRLGSGRPLNGQQGLTGHSMGG